MLTPGVRGVRSVMTRRNSRMPLYEAMRTGARRPPGAGGDARGEPVQLGGTIRLPTAAVLLVVAGVVLALVIAYASGYGIGRGQAEHAADEAVRTAERLRESAESPAVGASGAGGGLQPPAPEPADPEPSERTSRAAAVPSDRDGGPGNGDIVMGAAGAEAGRPAADPPSPGTGVAASFLRPPADIEGEPVFYDPRPDDSGRFYWALAHANRSGAEQVVRFLRGQGLEAYAFLSNTAGLVYRVTILPGLPTDDAEDPLVRAMSDEIERLGRLYESEFGRPIFHDAILYQFR